MPVDASVPPNKLELLSKSINFNEDNDRGRGGAWQGIAVSLPLTHPKPQTHRVGTAVFKKSKQVNFGFRHISVRGFQAMSE